MKGFYPIYCLIILSVFAFVNFTGRTFFNSSPERKWTKPGQRTIYYHK